MPRRLPQDGRNHGEQAVGVIVELLNSGVRGSKPLRRHQVGKPRHRSLVVEDVCVADLKGNEKRKRGTESAKVEQSGVESKTALLSWTRPHEGWGVPIK